MARSTCVKCGGSMFETVEQSPRGSNFKLIFIQCSSCGGVVGVMDYFNIGAKVENLEKDLGKVNQLVQNTNANVRNIIDFLNRMNR